MKTDYYVYIYLDPRKPGNFIYDNLIFEYEPFYVGKGKNNRIHQGLNDPNNTKNKKFKINDIRKTGLTPIAIKIYDNLSENISYELEKLTIKKIGKNNLTNRSKGSTSYKKELWLFNLKSDKKLIVNVLFSASNYYYLHDGSCFNKNLFLDIFEKSY